MKIEKISSSQIRCILTGEDLASRQLRLSELAYGTEKARALFRDMMEQASVQCGFDAENYPLMIEAIPLGADSIVLIVTKVDNPEELDTRFSNFAPSVHKDALPASEPPSPLSQLLRALRENAPDPDSAKSAEDTLKERRDFMITSRLYSFDTMDDVIGAAKILPKDCPCTSALYRDEQSGKYYLLIRMKGIEELGTMQGALAALSEYGTPEKVSAARQQFLITHCTALLKQDAIPTLAGL